MQIEGNGRPQPFPALRRERLHGNLKMATREYKYLPLAPSRCEIRVHEILPHPRLSTATLHCKIRPVFLAEEHLPQLATIFYCWEDPTSKNIIIVDVARLQVSARFFQVISRVAHADQVRIIWLDAVCINQADIEERARQVELMRTVCTRAS